MLLKNVLKTFRKKWLQLSAIGLIIVFSSMIYTMMSYGMGGIAEPTTNYLKEYAQEDFSVEMLSTVTAEESQYPGVGTLLSRGILTLSEIKRTQPATFTRIMDSRIAAFEEAYPDVSVELREYKTLDFELHGNPNKALIAKDAARINLSYMEEGVKPLHDDEIAVTKIYAQKNALQVGDPFMLDGKRYRITGFVLFPDYTLTAFDDTFNVDTGLQTLILVSDAAYEDIDADEYFRLAGVGRTGTRIDTSYNKDDLPFVIQIVPTADNIRSGAIYDELSQGRVTALGLSIFIAVIAVVIVSIMISNLLAAERGQIGILKAMGYRRIEIARPYFLAVIVMAFAMLVLGYLVGYLYAEPLKRLYLDFYLLPSVPIEQDIAVFATAVFAPLLSFALFSGAITYRMLGQGPLELLRPHQSTSMNHLVKYAGRLLSRARARTKFKYLHAVRSSGTFVVFFIGIMFSTILIIFSFMMNGMMERMTVGYLKHVDYKYQAYADPAKRQPDPKAGQEKFLSYPYAYLGDEVVSLQGLEPDNSLYNLIDDSGRKITGRIRNGAVISKGLGLKAGLGEGDTVRIKVDADHFDFVVGGATDEYADDRIYLDIGTLSKMISDNESSRLFNGIYSTSKPSSEYYRTIVSKDDLMRQSEAMSNYTDAMVNIMIGGAAVISASIVFVLTSFTVEKNYYAISLLKVLGYRRREVNSMILSSYYVYGLLSYVISVPIALLLLDRMMVLFLDEYGIIIPMQLNPVDLVKGLTILVLIFAVGTYASRKRIENVPLQEVLKTYGE